MGRAGGSLQGLQAPVQGHTARAQLSALAFHPHCNQFVSLVLVIGSFHLYYPSFGFMLHYSLEPLLLLLYHFTNSYCASVIWSSDLKCQPFPFLLSLDWASLPRQASPSLAHFYVKHSDLTSLLRASQSEELLSFFL